jgi:hypothetical protein
MVCMSPSLNSGAPKEMRWLFALPLLLLLSAGGHLNLLSLLSTPLLILIGNHTVSSSALYHTSRLVCLIHWLVVCSDVQ